MTVQPTHLTYMEQSHLSQDTAQVIDVITLEDGRTSLILDKTIFYPQGGGQPYDQGTIKSVAGPGILDVQETRFKDGFVHHIGTLSEGSIKKGQTVSLHLDEERRSLNSKNHPAGHLIDLAIM